MKNFDYSFLIKSEVPIDIYRIIASIYEYKGRQHFHTLNKTNSLDKYILHTKLRSTIESNKIEGIYTTEKRSKEIIIDKIPPQNLVEQEIVGYSRVYEMIQEDFRNIDISSNVMLQLHRDLYKYTTLSFGGKYKTSDNLIVSVDQLGNKKVIFKPLKAIYTENAMFNLCEAYRETIEENLVEPLLILPVFILDFLSIHPFNDGNGRISRLLTNLILRKLGFDVCDYVSYEKKIYDNLKMYYSTLNRASQDWHDNKIDYYGFIRYSLILLLDSYKEFDELFIKDVVKKSSKKERIIKKINSNLGSFSKKELSEKLIDISGSTIERVLSELLKRGDIQKIGDRKTARYKKSDI